MKVAMNSKNKYLKTDSDKILILGVSELIDGTVQVKVDKDLVSEIPEEIAHDQGQFTIK